MRVDGEQTLRGSGRRRAGVQSGSAWPTSWRAPGRAWPGGERGGGDEAEARTGSPTSPHLSKRLYGARTLSVVAHSVPQGNDGRPHPIAAAVQLPGKGCGLLEAANFEPRQCWALPE